MVVFSLLIIYKDGTEKTVLNVKEYGANERGYFYFVKNHHKSFIPFDVVRFFGREWDYNECQ